LYTVKIALNEHRDLLQDELDKLSPTLRKTIVIKKEKKFYRVSTLPTHKKALLTTLLPYYRKVFDDAFIDTIKTDSSKKSPKKSKNPKLLKESTAFYATLKNKVFYLCPAQKKENANFLLKVTFTDSSVSYTPILGKTPPMQALYKIDNNKLYIYQKALFNENIYTTYEKGYRDYYLLGSWLNGKKIKNLRYYIALDEAKKYLNAK